MGTYGDRDNERIERIMKLIHNTFEDLGQLRAVPKPPKRKKQNKNGEWADVRKELKVEFEKNGITQCELRLPDCTGGNFLSFAHTTKRRDVVDLKRVVLACINCHTKAEYSSEAYTGMDMEEYLESVIAKRI